MRSYGSLTNINPSDREALCCSWATENLSKSVASATSAEKRNLIASYVGVRVRTTLPYK